MEVSMFRYNKKHRYSIYQKLVIRIMDRIIRTKEMAAEHEFYPVLPFSTEGIGYGKVSCGRGFQAG
eukprot:4293778-Prorocentrum_lima.AAC.1